MDRSTDTLPEPLTPPDCDLRSFVYMPVDIIRLFSSEFHAKSTDAEWRAGFTLWLKSYHQVPAGSIPDDDVILARMAELGRDVDGWKALRTMALHGWVKCSDGRLYHPTVCEKANEAWTMKIRKRAGAEHTNSVKKQNGSGSQSVTPSVTQSVTDSATVSAADTATHTATVSERKERIGQDLKGQDLKGADAAARAKARSIVEEFDAIRAQVFGERLRRPNPAGDDIVIAQRWADQGLTAEILSDLFRARFVARKQAGQDPIGNLRYLVKAVEELGTVRISQSPPSPGNVHTHPAAELEQRKAAHIAALKIHLASPDTVPKPPASAYGLAYNRETQGVMLAPGPRPPIPAPQDAQAEGAA